MKIDGADTNEMDNFGDAVTISGDPNSLMFVAVGAPNAEDNGVLEVQQFICRT